MAEFIPTFTGSNHLGRMGETLAQFDANAAERLKAALQAKSEIARGVMSNLDRISHTSGPNAPDTMLGNWDMAPAFGGSEADRLHALYVAGQQADIAATQRSGRGGGGGGGGGDLDVGHFLGTDGNVYDWSDFDAATQASILDGTFSFGVAKGGPTYTGTPPDPGFVEQSDGSKQYNDGSVLRPDGTVVLPDGTVVGN